MSAELDLRTVSCASKSNFPFPKTVGFYTLDRNRNFLNDMSGLKYFKEPVDMNEVDFDLNVGFESFVKKPETAQNEGIRHVLRFILENIEALKSEFQSKTFSYDFVCFRGLLSSMMTSRRSRTGWTAYAVLHKNTIYMCKVDEPQEDYPNKEKFEYWGYKFETYLFANSPDDNPDTTRPVYQSEEFCVMYFAQLNNKKLLYGAEVDGVANTQVLDKASFFHRARFTEVKTHREITSPWVDSVFRQKHVKWYCQAYLAGISSIFVGFRNQSGIVSQVYRYYVSNLPSRPGTLWSKQECLGMLDSILDFVAHCMKMREENTLIKFVFSPETNKIVCTMGCDTAEYEVLPEWYTEGFAGTSTPMDQS